MANKVNKDNPGALFIPAGVITGMGFGILYEQVAPGMFIGLGIGFLLFAMASFSNK